jgi:hypothetical protein
MTGTLLRHAAVLALVLVLAGCSASEVGVETAAPEPGSSPAATEGPAADVAAPGTGSSEPADEGRTPDDAHEPGEVEEAGAGRAGGAGCADPLGCYEQPERVGAFDATATPEVSGLAASRRDPDVLFLLDDAPGTGEIWAVRTDGSLLAELPVDGMDARDTESLADGPCAADDATPCLYIGDIGDNQRRRDDIVVHRVVEPDLAQGIPDAPLASTTIRLRYPDGAHDAEALLVDDRGGVHIVTKAPFDQERQETGQARLYRAEAFADGVLTDLGPVPVPPPSVPLHSTFVGNVVTGGDHRDGRVLLRTYDQVLEYIAPDGERDLATLAEWTVRPVPAAFEPQSEALTWAADGCGYLTAGERVGDIWRVRCSEG